jgi:hypothetical protein
MAISDPGYGRAVAIFPEPGAQDVYVCLTAKNFRGSRPQLENISAFS